jgi:hypothetical protein
VKQKHTGEPRRPSREEQVTLFMLNLLNIDLKVFKIMRLFFSSNVLLEHAQNETNERAVKPTPFLKKVATCE